MINPNSVLRTSSSVALLGLSIYSSYILISWIRDFITVPSDNRRLVNAKKKGKVANFTDIPGPIGLPFFGTFFHLLPYIRRKRFELFGINLNKKYGGVCRVPVYPPIIFVDDPALAKQIANNPEAIIRNSLFADVMFDTTPTALFVLPTGEQWKTHRKSLQPAFGPIHLRDALEVSVDLADKLLDLWEKEPHRNVMNDFSALTGDVISKIAFSFELGAVEALISKAPVKFFEHNEHIAVIAQLRANFITTKYLWNLMGIGRNSAENSMDFLSNTLKQVLDNRRQRYLEEPDFDLRKVNWGLDLVDRLLSSNLSEKEIMDEIVGFFMAGHETTANSLTWAILELSKNPHVFDKMSAEIESVLGGSKPTMDILPSLKYLDSVFKETLRYHAVAALFVRETRAHCELSQSDGLVIAFPPGVQFFVNVAGMHLNEKYWGKDAGVFNPDRWYEGFVPISGSYLPFGDGPMNCIGQKMAAIEAKVILIRIAQRFKKVSISPHQGPIEPVTSVTHGLKHGLLIDVSKR